MPRTSVKLPKPRKLPPSYQADWDIDQKLADPQTPAEYLTTIAKKRPAGVVMHPNCPLDLWLRLTHQCPGRAIKNPSFPLYLLEAPTKVLGVFSSPPDRLNALLRQLPYPKLLKYAQLVTRNYAVRLEKELSVTVFPRHFLSRLMALWSHHGHIGMDTWVDMTTVLPLIDTRVAATRELVEFIRCFWLPLFKYCPKRNAHVLLKSPREVTRIPGRIRHGLYVMQLADDTRTMRGQTFTHMHEYDKQQVLAVLGLLCPGYTISEQETNHVRSNEDAPGGPGDRPTPHGPAFRD